MTNDANYDAKGSEAKILQYEDVEIFAPKKENFISEQEKFIESLNEEIILTPRASARLEKAESRVEELKGLN